MNLLQEPWMPVRLRDGTREWISPCRLSDTEIVAFDADRPDFNGALAQFAIGLLQTTSPANSASEWRQWFKTPPDQPTLREWFAAIEEAFIFDGDGARFMQDRNLQTEEFVAISTLLIEAPGENAVKNNTDLFIKRAHVRALCPRCAATALLALQINAPSGGAGHRTGLRGGGPLTTLITSAADQGNGLWHDIWLNVRERDSFLAQCGDATKAELHLRFPWLADITGIQAADGETAPAQVHPDHAFWAMPRRIRLDFEQLSAGTCDICAMPSERRLQRYATRNYGLNYKGAWEHPLSPYYETTGGWLPLHPQPGGLGYRQWLGWLAGAGADPQRPRKPARVVEHALQERGRQLGTNLRLWAFGYDMDNMKARCWYEATVPLYGLGMCSKDAQREVEVEVGQHLAAAEMAAFFLRSGVKEAWFGADARGDFSHIDASFWSSTEPAFYRQLEARIAAARDEQAFDRVAASERWLGTLQRNVLRLFDEIFVGAGAVERQHPRRAAEARRKLRAGLYGKKLRESLGLPVAEPAPGKKAKRTSKKPPPPSPNDAGDQANRRTT